MAKKLRPGDKVNGYEITRFINQGALAISYAAKSASGEKVFLKQYKSPSVTVDWYRGYVEYQRELKRRIESTPAKRFTYRLIDFFEATWGHPCYFQVFEFVEQGHDLEQILDQIRENPAAFSWEQRLTFAKVIMGSINALHQAGIIHCDLKPPNIQLFKDDTIDAGFVVKLIDMDYSILNDRQAPWHGLQGYVGSPGYFSPEHLSPGGVPESASDVFTCGLILYELLAGAHPYRFDETEDFLKAAVAHDAPVPSLIGTMPEPAVDADVADALHRCLSPTASHRPSAKDMVLVLNGRLKLPPTSSAAASSTPTAPTPTAATPVPVPPSAPRESAIAGSPELSLVTDTGQAVKMHVRTSVGKYLLQGLGSDAVYYHPNEQFILEPNGEGRWYAKHNPAAKHQTLLNGNSIVDPTPLVDGDILAVGSAERGIEKLRVTVRLT